MPKDKGKTYGIRDHICGRDIRIALRKGYTLKLNDGFEYRCKSYPCLECRHKRHGNQWRKSVSTSTIEALIASGSFMEVVALSESNKEESVSQHKFKIGDRVRVSCMGPQWDGMEGTVLDYDKSCYEYEIELSSGEVEDFDEECLSLVSNSKKHKFKVGDKVRITSEKDAWHNRVGVITDCRRDEDGHWGSRLHYYVFCFIFLV